MHNFYFKVCTAELDQLPQLIVIESACFITYGAHTVTLADDAGMFA